MRYSFPIIVIILISCSNNQNKVASSDVANMETNMTSLCGEEITLDTSKLKLRSVGNLRIYNGFKFLKLGKLKKEYVNCLTCTKGSVVDTCALSSPINFLDEDWKVNTYFINDTLSRIELNKEDYSLSESFYKLQIVLGKPNLQDIKTVKVENSSKTYTIKAHDKRQFEPYSESINYYISYLKSERESSKNASNIISNGPKPFDDEINKNYYEGEPKKVRIQYLPFLHIQASWESTIILQYDIIKKSFLKIGTGSRYNNNDNNVRRITDGYEVNDRFNYVINLYRDKETISLFQNLYVEQLEQKKEALKNKDIQDKKATLQKF